MPMYHVTTAETVYETYIVPADDADEAKAHVLERLRGEACRTIRSFGDAPGDDIEIVGVREVDWNAS